MLNLLLIFLNRTALLNVELLSHCFMVCNFYHPFRKAKLLLKTLQFVVSKCRGALKRIMIDVSSTNISLLWSFAFKMTPAQCRIDVQNVEVSDTTNR